MVIVIVLFGICIVTMAVGLGILLGLADRRERKSTR